MIIRFLTLVLLSLTLIACAASGPIYTEEITNRPLPSELARMTIYRTGDTLQYSARSVRIAYDESTLGSVDYKGFNIFDVPAGQHTLTADMWDAPGKCDVALDLQPATNYYFQVLPRSGSLIAGLAGGLLGMAAESGGRECGGAFTIIPVEKEAAIGTLQELRLSN